MLLGPSGLLLVTSVTVQECGGLKWFQLLRTSTGPLPKVVLPLIAGYNLRPRPVLGAETPATPAQACKILGTSTGPLPKVVLPLTVGHNLRPRPVLGAENRLHRQKLL